MGTRRENIQRESFNSKSRNDVCRAVKVRRKFFINRVVPDWNKLPYQVTSAPSTHSFKA